MTQKTPKLHEILAVEKDLFDTATAMVDDCKVAFEKKSDHFRGLVTRTSYFDTSRAGEDTTEQKLLVTTVGERLAYVGKFVSKYWDAMLQKEASNQNANADLIVDGVTIAENVPATFLLGMESRLKTLRDLLLKIPTLEPGANWQPDATASMPDVFKVDAPVGFKTEKTIEFKVLVPQSDKFPANIEKWTVDKNVARIERELTSGMWTPLRKATVLGNLDTMLEAVKKARMRGNDTDVVKREVGKKIWDYILKS